MIFVSSDYYSTSLQLWVRECGVSDDGGSQSSKLARLSLTLRNLLADGEARSGAESILIAKYPFQVLDEERGTYNIAFSVIMCEDVP